jgi:hypothetical protein
MFALQSTLESGQQNAKKIKYGADVRVGGRAGNDVR